MDKETRDNLFAWYQDYAFSFAKNGKLLPAMKKLKFDHSMRVSQIAKKIAREEGWSDTDVLLAEVSGLFHDVGRYQQYREHKTFRDHCSVNHAELGCEIIENTGCLDCLSSRERNLVYETTRMHNMKDIPEDLSKEIAKFLLLVRDSDKLDIFYVIYDAVANDHLDDYPEVVHGVDINGGPTDEVVRLVLEGKSINYSVAKSLVDFELILLQWVYDFHFQASYSILDKRDYIHKMQTILPVTPQINQIAGNAQAHVAKKLAAGLVE